MPTKRFYRLFLLTIVLYLFANQTQVGWLYVIVSLLAGVILFSWIINRRAIRQISAVREIDLRDEYYEGEIVEISLNLATSSNMGGYQLLLDELCPIADPDGDLFLQQWFVEAINAQPPTINYDVELYKRGLFDFPAVEMTSRFPFGLFQRSNYSEGLVSDETLSLLVYPEIKPLRRLPLLDRQPAAEMVYPRAGSGNEFLALRQYQHGDSPRHIHWRSVARTGQLISKEFADESLPGMALLIDRQRYSDEESENEHGRSKHTPFETAVKIAASLGDYALRSGHALTIVDNEAPRGAVTADMLLQYLARVEADQDQPFNEKLDLIQQNYLAVVLPYPNQKAIDSLVELKQRGIAILAILLDESTFPNRRVEACLNPLGAARCAPTLENYEIECHIIKHGEDWAEIIGEEHA